MISEISVQPLFHLTAQPMFLPDTNVGAGTQPGECNADLGAAILVTVTVGTVGCCYEELLCVLAVGSCLSVLSVRISQVRKG